MMLDDSCCMYGPQDGLFLWLVDIKVFSVIAQQILTIQTAVTAGKTQFDFEGRLLPLDYNFGVFITMNPGYAYAAARHRPGVWERRSMHAFDTCICARWSC
jgi:hypothetical protein